MPSGDTAREPPENCYSRMNGERAASWLVFSSTKVGWDAAGHRDAAHGVPGPPPSLASPSSACCLPVLHRPAPWGPAEGNPVESLST